MKKRLNKIYSEFDKTKLYSVDEGVDIALNSSNTKFEETIDIAVNAVSYTHLTLPTKRIV